MANDSAKKLMEMQHVLRAFCRFFALDFDHRSRASSVLPSRSRREKRPSTRATGLTGTWVERPSL